ncbi:MAG: nucleotide exchange factor GrpE [Fimbriiglobus sp.]
MTSESLDTLLQDFRTWLEAQPQQPAPLPPVETLDIATVVGHFTALRQEVNMLTKTTRVAVEQNAEAITQLKTPAVNPDAKLLPLLKAILEISDSLTLALKPIEKSQAAIDETLAEWPEPHDPEPETEEEAPRPGFLARLFGAQPTPARQPSTPLADLSDQQALLERLRSLTTSVSEGYAMSLRRIEKLLPQYNLTPIETEGLPFDPETMEVVEVVAGPRPGYVVEEVRRGYHRQGQVFRFALVKVAR